MSREPSVEKLARQAGRLQEQLLNIAKRSQQTAIKDRKKGLPVEKVKPPVIKRLAVKRPVPDHLKPYVFQRKKPK